jgi:Skp family chaperone for outer membrane proteins
MDPEVIESAASETPVSSPDSSPSPDSSESGFLSGLFDTIDNAPAEGAEPAPDPEPETAEEPAPDPEPEAKPAADDLPEVPKTAADWKKLKGLKKQVEEEKEALRKELEELKAAPKTAANEDEIARVKSELEEYKTRYEEYDKKVALLDVKQSREYQENIAQPLARAESIIQDFATKYELSIPEIAKAAMNSNILERNAQLSEMVVSMNDFDKFEFKKVVDEAQQLFSRAQMVEQNASAARKYAEEQYRQQQEQLSAQQKQAFDSAADKVWQGITKKMPFVVEDAAAAERLAKDARDADLASASPEVQAYARYASVLLPSVLEKYEQQAAKIKELESAISKRSGAAPRAKSGSVPREVSEEPEDFMSGLDDVLGKVSR